MGQRHQIYVKLPNKKIIGLHHQWLFGLRALSQLKNFLTFLDNAVKNNNGDCFDYHAYQVLESCYAINIVDGYVSRVHLLESISPMREDNNNGITCIDLSDIDSPTYCFASLIGLECLNDSITSKDYKNKTPLGYKTWLYLHYPTHNYSLFSFFDDYKVMTQKTLDEFLNYANWFITTQLKKPNRLPDSLQHISIKLSWFFGLKYGGYLQAILWVNREYK